MTPKSIPIHRLPHVVHVLDHDNMVTKNFVYLIQLVTECTQSRTESGILYTDLTENLHGLDNNFSLIPHIKSTIFKHDI